ncbi:MAG: hypothetical protein IKX69_05305, partial [Prevotella sp.]|nr:hypothetical protein [Prevotella sp.]
MKRILSLLATCLLAMSVHATDVRIATFRYAGPYEVHTPVMLDTVNLNAESYKPASLLDTPLKLDLARHAVQTTDSLLPECRCQQALCLLQTDLQTLGYAKASIAV